MSEGCSGGSCSTCPGGSGSDGEDRLPPGMLEHYDLNTDTRKGILVFIQTEDGVPDASTAGILTLARNISDDRVFATAFGGVEIKERFKEIFALGVDTLYHMRNRDRGYRPLPWASAIMEVAERVNAAVLLFPDTRAGEELASLCAAKADAGICVRCMDLRMENGTMAAKKDLDTGTIGVRFVSRPAVIVASSTGLPAPVSDPGRKGTVINRPYSLEE
ncbi:MAG: hypothetical protein PHX75_01500 [Candidatus Methanomethylophilaceae archaeon]|nr:hypothetical protein [Candidatus Methanomethylophilaceae archaeon]